MQRAWFGLFLAVACSGGGGNERLPAAPAEGGSSSTAGKRGILHAGNSSQAGDGAAGEGAGQGLAGASDGLRLILVLQDHSGFGELSRASRTAAFEGDPDTTVFAKINSLKPMSGQSVGWPVLSSDGKDLYFLSYFGQALVVQSQLGTDGRF